ncbi:homeobox protein Hox-A9a-like [Amphiura filiformis]|uniref:homeobox protein Hox-A9a-like n=1 Tax=Amphiura filiformis TaxID=82378 RepID=UPI003B22702B
MQQWPASRPRYHSNPVDSTTSSLISLGDFDGFERNANDTLWEDNGRNDASGSCMFTALSQAIASVSCQPHPRLCNDTAMISPSSTTSSSSSSASFVSSSLKSSPGTRTPCLKFANAASTAGTVNDGGTILPLIPTSLADVFCTSLSDEQSETDAASRGSPDSHYATSPGVTPDTTLIDYAGSPSRDSGVGKPKRRPYSKLQLMHLEQEFQQSMYPCRERRAWLSQLLSLSERQVKIWFQNRRTKLKRTVEREKKEHAQMQRDMATLAMQFYAPAAIQ